MVLAQEMATVVVFWAIVGGLGASLLLPRDAVPDPRQLRRGSPDEGLCDGRRVGRDCRRRRPAARWFRHDASVLARRLHVRAGRDRDRPGERQADPRRPLRGARSIDAVGAGLSVLSAAGSFGLSFGLAMAGGILLAVLALSFNNMAEDSPLIPPAQQQAIAEQLNEDAEVMSDAQLEAALVDEPPAVRDEVIRINSDATSFALQIALLVPILASLLGLINSFRMVRLPEIAPSTSRSTVRRRADPRSFRPPARG